MQNNPRSTPIWSARKCDQSDCCGHARKCDQSDCCGHAGITQDVDALATLLHNHGALACFDYAGAGPYVPITMAAPPGQPLGYKDAVTLSPHKLLGGPGSCGLLVARRELFGDVPTVPGGWLVQRYGRIRAWMHARGSALKCATAPGLTEYARC